MRGEVRIFTPARELAFAGHPTIGTAWVLATRGMLPAGTREASLEEGIGPVSVRLEGDPSRPTSSGWPTARRPSARPSPNGRATRERSG